MTRCKSSPFRLQVGNPCNENKFIPSRTDNHLHPRSLLQAQVPHPRQFRTVRPLEFSFTASKSPLLFSLLLFPPLLSTRNNFCCKKFLTYTRKISRVWSKSSKRGLPVQRCAIELIHPSHRSNETSKSVSPVDDQNLPPPNPNKAGEQWRCYVQAPKLLTRDQLLPPPAPPPPSRFSPNFRAWRA